MIEYMIDSLRRLPHNWDTYGSPPISEKALERMEVVLAICEGLEPESLVPLSGGGVLAEWYASGCLLKFAVWPMGEVEYLCMDNDEVLLEEESPGVDAACIRRCVQQFMTRKATRAAL